jgi:hypothetical protein
MFAWPMQKLVKLSLVVLLLQVLALVSIYVHLSSGSTLLGELLARTENDNLSFSYSKCSSEWNKTEVLYVRWLDNSTIEISTNVSIGGGAFLILGGYHLHKDIIELTYSGVADSTPLCLCNHQLTYTISNLYRQDYLFTITNDPIWVEPSWYHRFFRD